MTMSSRVPKQPRKKHATSPSPVESPQPEVGQAQLDLLAGQVTEQVVGQLRQLGLLPQEQERTPPKPRARQLPKPRAAEAVTSPALDAQQKPEPSRGTRRVLRESIERVLTEQSLTTTQMARVLSIRSWMLEDELKALRDEQKIYNVGWEDVPIWTWKVGNDTDTKTLHKVVRRLIAERPMHVRDLVRATGASERRVSGVLIELQRSTNVIDVGHNRSRRYFLISEARDASLAPKVRDNKPIHHGRRLNQQLNSPKGTQSNDVDEYDEYDDED
ncbi:MAG: hypothetical protein ACTHU0_26840 [Kofleriaceae bacterium]